MGTADSVICFADSTFQHNHTAGTIGGHGFDACCQDSLHLVFGDLFGDLGMTEKRICPAETAAAVGVFHFLNLMAGGFKKCPRFFPHIGAALQMTRIVICHDFLPPRALSFSEAPRIFSKKADASMVLPESAMAFADHWG